MVVCYDQLMTMQEYYQNTVPILSQSQCTHFANDNYQYQLSHLRDQVRTILNSLNLVQLDFQSLKKVSAQKYLEYSLCSKLA
jgi:hypothetical protein